MATAIDAIRRYGPRIEPGAVVHHEEAIRWLMTYKKKTRGEAEANVADVADLLEFYNNMGRTVNLERLGSFTQVLHLAGDFDRNYRAPVNMRDLMKQNFTGVITNAENIGKTQNELIAMWNADPANASDQIPTS
jgi:hypothetical protein